MPLNPGLLHTRPIIVLPLTLNLGKHEVMIGASTGDRMLGRAVADALHADGPMPARRYVRTPAVA